MAASILLAAVLCGSAHGQTIAYLLPDIGAPGMNTYVEIVGPTAATGNFGTDGFYANNPGDSVRVICDRADDTAYVTIGPLVVSWNGRLVSTQIFVHPDVQPNATDWRLLQPRFVIPLRVTVNGATANADTFYLVRPQPAIASGGGGTLGDGTLGIRSRRGAMIVDSLTLGPYGFAIATADCDAATPGNQAYLPFVLLSRGRISGTPGTVISASAAGRNGGPGGGGGGGNFCDVTGSGSNGGDGFTGGGRGGRNGSGVPFATDEFRDPGEGTGPRVNSTGTSLNGVAGATGPAYEAAGGGTGHPFGVSGLGCNDGKGCNPPGGYGGGSGQQQTRGGGGGGYATDGTSSAADNGGHAHGNAELVPLAGGSGGAGGNPMGISVCSGEGGGGGGALLVYAPSITDVTFSANGADGQARSNGPGGSGSGGGISVGTKVHFEPGQVYVRGGATSIAGGAGRVRIDGPRNTIVIQPASASTYRGPSTDTSRFVPKAFILTGTGSGDTIDVYLRSASMPWTRIGRIDPYTGNTWSLPVVLPREETYYLVAAQARPVPSGGAFDSEPSWVLSQAAANVLDVRAYPKIAGARALTSPPLLCESESMDTVFVRNDGDADLVLSAAAFARGGEGFSLVLPPAFPVTVASKDSAMVVVRFRPAPGRTGAARDTLLLANNDTSAVRNPWRIALDARKDSAGLAASVATIDFGRLILCERRAIDTTIIITNTGTVALPLDAPVITGTDVQLVSPAPGAFPLLLDTTARTLPVRIRFAPGTAGSDVSAVIRFATGPAWCAREIEIGITGRADSVGVDADRSAAFAPILCAGGTSDTSVLVTNTGTMDITLDGPATSNPDFAIAGPSFPVPLRPGESARIALRYAPAGSGSSAGVLTFRTVPCGIPVSIDLTGRKDSIAIAAADLDFGLQPPSAFPVTRDIPVRNTGSRAITLQSSSFSTGVPFTVVAGIPAVIQPGATALVTVRFDDPGMDGTYGDTLAFGYDPFCAPSAARITGSRGTASVLLEIDTVSAAPGEIIDVPVRLRSSVNPQLFGATGISVTLRYDRSLLEPQFTPPGVMRGNDRVIPLSLPLLPDADGVLTRLTFRAMLGTVDATPLLLDSASGVGGTLQITTAPGLFTLRGVCRDGGTRLFDGSVRAHLAQNRPNPFNPRTDIEYTTIEDGPVRLQVFDRLGRLVATLADGAQPHGTFVVTFDGSTLPSGMYVCVLQSGSLTLTRTMVLIK